MRDHIGIFVLQFYHFISTAELLTRKISQASIKQLINNGNCTEWRAIWSEIKRVITKSHDREAGVRFVITSLISDQN